MSSTASKLAGLALVVILLACEQPSSGPPGEEALPIRPGVIRLLPSEHTAAASQNRLDGVPSVIDVAIDGDRIAVLYGITSPLGHFAGSGILLSEDGGASWRDAPHLEHDTYFGAQHALLWSEGRLYTIWSGESYVVSRVDLAEASARLVQVGELAAGSFPLAIGDEIWRYDGWGSGPVHEVFQFSRHAPGDGSVLDSQMTLVENAPDHSACLPTNWYPVPARPDPRRVVLAGECVSRGADSEWRYCVSEVEPPAAIVPSRECVSTPEEAVIHRASRPFFAADGVMGSVLEDPDADGVRLARIGHGPGGPSLEIIDVGPGRLAPSSWLWGRARWRYGDLLVLYEELPMNSTRTTVYRYASSRRAFTATDLPTRPCPTGVDCGWLYEHAFGRSRRATPIEWIEPLGRAEYLVFYVVQELPPSSGESRPALYVSRERLELSGAPDERVEAGALERACALEQSCSDLGSIALCAEEGMVVNSADPAGDPEHAARLAATSCEQLARARFGAHWGEPCTGRDARCIDGDVYTCAEGSLWRLSDCARRGASCGIVEADYLGCVAGDACAGVEPGSCSADGSTYCGGGEDEVCSARGFACSEVNGIGCRASVAACNELNEQICVGEVAYACSGPGLGVPLWDCSRVPGMHCEEGRCVADVPDCEASVPPRCEGDRLVYCLAHSTRELDCAALGLRCGQHPGHGRTQCI